MAWVTREKYFTNKEEANNEYVKQRRSYMKIWPLSKCHANCPEPPQIYSVVDNKRLDGSGYPVVTGYKLIYPEEI